MTYIPVAIAVLSILSVASITIAKLLRDRGNEAAAEDLEIAHEALEVAVNVVEDVGHGETVVRALVDQQASPEAQDLYRRIRAKVAGRVGVLLPFVFLGALAGCSSEKEQLRACVCEGRILLFDPQPGDPDWEARRGVFLMDAEAVAPLTSEGK
jgi:hypothetical protein